MSLDYLFEPSSIAIIGATKNKKKVGYAILKNILDGGYKGKIYPVNPKYEYIEGLKVYKTVSQIQSKIDLAIVAIPLRSVPQVMQELGKKEVRSAVIISAGGRETGEKGKKLEEEILNIAKKYSIRFLGPNCFGFINTSLNLNANFGSSMPLKGDTAFISQSGALFSSILDWAISENIGFSYCISVGNMADLEFGEIIAYLGQKENVRRILIYMESLYDAYKFVSFSQDVMKKIPVVITKAGRTEAGSKAAVSHTGALTGKDFLYSACFERLGAIRADTVELMFDLTEALSKQPLPEGNRFAILTNAGGPGVLSADRLGYWNIKPADLKESTIKKLDEVLPENWSKGNPVDILGDATPDRYRKSLEILLGAFEIDGIIGILTPQFMTEPEKTAKEVIELLKSKNKKPVYFSIIGGQKVKKAREILEKSKVAVYETPEEAVDCMVMSYMENTLKKIINTDKPVEPIFSTCKKERTDFVKKLVSTGKNIFSIYETKKLLEKYDIPVNKTFLITQKKEIYDLQIQYPVVVKIQSPDIVHKTEAKAVIYPVSSQKELLDAYDLVIKNAKAYKPEAKIEGVIIEQMVPEGFEIILGSSRDKIFGQYVMFGSGGRFVEFLKDVSFGFPPLTENFSVKIMQDTKIYKLLKDGFRNIPPADMKKLQDILIRFSTMLVENPQIVEIEINPLIVRGDQIFAVDGRMKALETKKEPHIIFTNKEQADV